MPEYLAPGVYVEEIDTGPVPIEGVSTSTTGFVGRTAQGPTDPGLPVLVTSFAEFTRTFGGYLAASPDDTKYTGPGVELGNSHILAHAVQGFFENGGSRLYIKRVISSATSATPPKQSTTGLTGGLVTRLSRDTSTNAIQAQLSTLRGIQNGTKLTFTQVKNGITTTQTVPVTSYVDSTKTATWADADKLQSIYEARYTSVATDRTAATPAVISSLNAGAWGDNISVQIFYTTLARAQVVSVTGSTVLLNSTANFYPGAIVEFNTGQAKVYGKVASISGNSIILKTAPAGVNPGTTVSSCEFRLTVSSGGVVEDYPTLTLDDTTPYYWVTQINSNSAFISVSGNDDTTEDPFTMPTAADGLNISLTGGSDGGLPSADDYVGTDNGPGQRTGIQALEDIEEISIIAAPGITNQTVVNALILQCEQLRYRFAVLDPNYPYPPAGQTKAQITGALDDVQLQRQLYDTHYAALYFPRVIVNDPLTQMSMVLPPSGHIAGIYARTDDARGVYKAPANELIMGILDLDLIVNKREQEVLNPPPHQINVLRDFRTDGRGLRVWGARCITSDAEWKYVNVRRFFIFIEESLDRGTQWVVFEPNDYPLWARVTQSISNFLTSVWHDGALMGQKVEEAFFVRCDRTTMTQDDIDNGRLIILVGIAPVKPAEFVIIRISQFTASASTTGQ